MRRNGIDDAAQRLGDTGVALRNSLLQRAALAVHIALTRVGLVAGQAAGALGLGRGFEHWRDGIEDGDPDALTCLYWCMLLQNGEPAAILSDKIDFPVGPLYTAISEAQKREAEAAEAAAKAELEAEAERAASLGPTRPAGPPSPAPPSRPDTTPPPPGQLPEAPSSTGSGPATSSSSAPSTSSSSPASADLLRIRSGG